MSEFVWEYQEVDVQLPMLKILNPLSKFWWLKFSEVPLDCSELSSESFNAVMAISLKIDPKL